MEADNSNQFFPLLCHFIKIKELNSRCQATEQVPSHLTTLSKIGVLHVCAHVHARGGQRKTLSIFSTALYLTFLRPFAEPHSPLWPGWLAGELLGPSCLCCSWTVLSSFSHRCSGMAEALVLLLTTTLPPWRPNLLCFNRATLHQHSLPPQRASSRTSGQGVMRLEQNPNISAEYPKMFQEEKGLFKWLRG